jgi:hypothetical protein
MIHRRKEEAHSRGVFALTKESLVNRHTRTEGRVPESAGIRRKNRADGAMAQTHWPRLEGLVPRFFRDPKRLDRCELFNKNFLPRAVRGEFLFHSFG